MLGTAIGGNVADIQAVRFWVESTSTSVTATAALLAQQRAALADTWTDLAGDLFQGALAVGERNARDLVAAIPKRAGYPTSIDTEETAAGSVPGCWR